MTFDLADLALIEVYALGDQGDKHTGYYVDIVLALIRELRTAREENAKLKTSLRVWQERNDRARDDADEGDW